MSVTLIPYQAAAVQRGVQLKRAVVKSPMGSGKTIMCLAIEEQLGLASKGPTIVCARTNAQLAWRRDIPKIFPGASIGVMTGLAKQRQKLWERPTDFILMTYISYLKDFERGWIPGDLNTMCDEAHRYMRKRKNATYEAIRTNTLHSEMVLMPTGTPMRKGPEDMWPMMHISNRKMFSAFWPYVNTWCNVVDTGISREIVGPKNFANFKQEILGRYTVWVPNSETDKYLPAKNKVLVPVEPTDEQHRMMGDLIKDMRLQHADGSLLITPNQMTVITRLRQILCCPKLLGDQYGYGAALEEIVERLGETDAVRNVIFTPFAESIQFIKERLEREISTNQKVWTLQGGLELEELERRVNGFNASGNDIMVCSVLYAEAFEFPRTQQAFFCGFDWAWDTNEQAEDRLRRLSSESKHSDYFYIIHPGHMDEHVWNVVNSTHSNVRLVTPKDAVELLVR